MLRRNGKLIVALLGGLAALLAAAAQLFGAFNGHEPSAEPALHQDATATGEGAKAFNAGRDLDVKE